MRKHVPGLRILPLSTDSYVPGVILERDKMRFLGHCRDVLPDEPESSWKFSKSDASIIYGTISMDRKIDNNAKVLGVFSFRGAYGRGLYVNIDIQDVRGAFLALNQLQLHPKLNALRQVDRRGRWRQVNNQLVVLEAYYASEFKACFKRNNKIITKGELEDITMMDVGAGVEYAWETDKSLIITRNKHLPFGVRGFTV